MAQDQLCGIAHPLSLNIHLQEFARLVIGHKFISFELHSLKSMRIYPKLCGKLNRISVKEMDIEVSF